MQQFVIWGDKLPFSVILPVSIGIGPGEICTVEAPLEYSAVQLTTLICRHCQLPDSIIEAVADIDARVLVNGEAVYPLDPGACRAADTAQLQGAILRPHLPSRVPVVAPSSDSQGYSASSESTSVEIARLVRPLEGEQGTLDTFTIFAEGAPPLVLVPLWTSSRKPLSCFQALAHNVATVSCHDQSQVFPLCNFASGVPLSLRPGSSSWLLMQETLRTLSVFLVQQQQPSWLELQRARSYRKQSRDEPCTFV